MRHLFRPLLVLGAVAALLSGCAAPYTPAPQILPAHIRKIYIRPVVNNTTQYGIEERLTLNIVDEFIRDGRFEVVNDEDAANGVLVTEINRYILQPLTYSQADIPQQYKLWVLVNVYFIDRVNDVTLWAEPNLEGIQIFFDATQVGGRTEEEVREMIWENLSRDIVKRTVQGFGSVTGASERKVPH